MMLCTKSFFGFRKVLFARSKLSIYTSEALWAMGNLGDACSKVLGLRRILLLFDGALERRATKQSARVGA